MIPTPVACNNAAHSGRPLNLAMVLFRYFPWGGMQANFLRIAEACVMRGHRVNVYTLDWQGERPAGIQVEIVKAPARRNHVRYAQFARRVQQQVDRASYDLVIGFNRMPGLDLYYAADPCYVERIRKTRPGYYPFTPRYRHFRDFERRLFEPASGTRILALSRQQIDDYSRCYGTQAERFQLLPPGVPADRIHGADASALRREFRVRYGCNDNQQVLLMIGSGFERKGFDRGLRAAAALPEPLRGRCRLVVAGKGREGALRRLALRLGLGSQLVIVPGTGEIPLFLQGADLLLHPARSENTGNVIVEAIAAGLPVLCSGACGFAFHVEQAQAGEVLDETFRQAAMNRVLQEMLASPEAEAWRNNALDYGAREDLYSRTERAVDAIESLAESIIIVRKNA